MFAAKTTPKPIVWPPPRCGNSPHGSNPSSARKRLLPNRVQIPHSQRDDPGALAPGVELDAIASRRRKDAVGKHAFAVVGKHFDAGAVDKDAQVNGRTFLELSSVDAGKIFAE